MKIPAKGFTHGGKFHADDVFSTALLQILRPDIQVTRGFVVPDDFDGIVYDVGGGMFDHHSEPRECRPNGVPYAAFGLLWRLLGAQLVGEHQARLLDENFIQPLDLNDNTGEQNSLADAIGSFNPLWDSKDDPDVCFWRAVPVAKQILENEIAAANAVNRADDTVRRAYASMKDGIVVLPAYMPWKNGLYKTDAIFVVYPSQRGGYSAQCVNDHRTKRSKQPFPVAWAGKPEDKLREVSGLGLRFCQPRRGAGADPCARLGLPAALPGRQPVRRLDERSGPPRKSPPQRQGRGQVHKKPWQGRRAPGLRREMRR